MTASKRWRRRPEEACLFPVLYALIDRELLRMPAEEFAASLAEAGVGLVQYRAKRATARELFETSRSLVERLGAKGVRVIVNDRADVAAMTNAGGVHVGQGDLPPEDARKICGAGRWVGVSTHNVEQVRRAASSSADYIAVGPIFATVTKEKPGALVGTSLIREARELTSKPIIAIGGITLERAAEVFEAGADSVAVASDLLLARDPASRAGEYLDLARRVFPAMSRGERSTRG